MIYPILCMSLVERIKVASEGMDERSKFIYNFISYKKKEFYLRLHIIDEGVLKACLKPGGTFIHSH